MIKWSRVRLILSILTCEGLFATFIERVQYAPGPRKASQPVPVGSAAPLHDYAGAVHVHSTYSDGTGTIEEIGEAANKAGLDFVIMCDHSSLEARQDGRDGWHGRSLMLIGTEVTTDTGHLLALNVPDSFLPSPLDAREAQQRIVDSGGVGFIALPCDLKDHWRDISIRHPAVGLEVFNLSAVARAKINLPALAVTWRRYNSKRPNRAFNLYAARPKGELRLWDKLTRARYWADVVKVVGIASVDAHAVMRFGGKEYPYPTYAEVFRTARTHVLTPEPLSGGAAGRHNRQDEALVYDALAAGHCYMSYDNYGDPTGFSFRAYPTESPIPTVERDTVVRMMGDHVLTGRAQDPARRLVVRVPRERSLIRLFRNGRAVASVRGGYLDYLARGGEPGVYRVEVYRYTWRIGGICIGTKPWIFSNPIYLTAAVRSEDRKETPSTGPERHEDAEPVLRAQRAS